MSPHRVHNLQKAPDVVAPAVYYLDGYVVAGGRETLCGSCVQPRQMWAESGLPNGLVKFILCQILENEVIQLIDMCG